MGERLFSNLPALLVVLPLAAAPIALLFASSKIFWKDLAWLTAFSASALSFLITCVLFPHTFSGEVISYSLGGYAAPLGIEYRLDIASNLLLFIVSATATLGLLFARKSVAKELPEYLQPYFYISYLLTLGGLLGVLITNDAFNMFVFLEISSLATYGMIALGFTRDRRALTASFRYLIIGTVGATFFVMGVFFLYAATGTLNITDIAQQLAHQDRHDPSAQQVYSLYVAEAFILVGLAIKIALFPLHFWLPNAYAFAPSAATVFLSAAATKVSIFALLRFLFAIFGFQAGFSEETLHSIILPLAIVGMLTASLQAILVRNLKHIFAYSSIAQVGYIMLGIGIGTRASLEASFVFIFQHALAKCAIFMALGCIAYRQASLNIEACRGIAKRMPWTMAAFTIAAMGLIGVPLTGGFISKWLLASAALQADYWLIAFFISIVSLMAALYVWRVLEAAYLKAPPEGAPPQREEAPLSMLLPLWITALASVYFGLDTRLPINAALKTAEIFGSLAP